MSITYPQLLQALELDPNKDPFGKWNAADERDLLPACFVAPPYFASVLGNPKAPSSSIVFAPTGAGKTAQCVMIQQRASDSANKDSLLALVYDDFERQGIQSTKEATLASHLRALTRIATAALLTTIGQKALGSLSFSPLERDELRYLARTYIGAATTETIEAALRSIRTPWQKLTETINSATSSIPLLGQALKLLGQEPTSGTLIQVLEAASKLKDTPQPKRLEESPKASPQEILWFDLERALRFLAHFFDATYILIDRVDETSFTSKNAGASFDLISPLLTNLALLNPQGAKWAFKFFLWNGVEKRFLDVGRGDRIQIYKVHWHDAELVEMLNKRLAAYSHQAVQSITDIFHPAARQIENISITDCKRSPGRAE